MTAYRVIDDHRDLDGIGSLSHDQLDTHVSGTTFLFVSGSAPPLGRRLTAGTNITLVDGGPGGNLTISSTGGGGGSPGAVYVKSWMEAPGGALDGINSTFTLTNSPDPSTSLMLFVNGVLQKQGASFDYTLAGSTVSMLYVPSSGSNLAATYQYQQTTGQTSWSETPSGDVNSINMVYTISNTPNPLSSLMLFINGVLQKQGASADYVIAGTTIVMNYAPSTGSNISATYPY